MRSRKRIAIDFRQRESRGLNDRRPKRSVCPLADVWAEQPGKFFCISTKSETEKWRDHFFTRDQFDEIDDFVAEHEDYDVYWCPHGFSEPRRQKACAVVPKLLWADLDEVDPRDLDLKPTIAIQSSPGRYAAIWKIDSVIDEDLNKRLTYAIGADRSGWDLTQVLRAPGSFNYKYKNFPKVKILWDSGPTHRLSEVAKKLPPERQRVEGDSSVYRRYEKKMPHWLRRALMSDKPTVGKRSEMLWKMEHALLDIGCSRDEAFELLKTSPWNKFEGRDQQLRRELDKIVESKFSAPRDSGQPVRFAMTSLADVEIEDIEWIWYPYLARGELTILEGDPDVGKSYLAQRVCGAICDGVSLPSPRPDKREPGTVIYFDIENTAATVTKRRLSDLRRPANFFQEETPFSMNDADNLNKVREAMTRVNPDVVVFDTLNTYLGKVNTDNATDSAQALVVFRMLAREFGCAVLLLRHLTKTGREKAIYRGQGSIAFTGVARIVIACGPVPDSPNLRAAAITKLNIAPKPRALTYTIRAKPTLKDPNASGFEWGEYIDLDAEQLIGGTERRSHGEVDDAVALLERALINGPADKKELQQLAAVQGLSWTTVKRAAKVLGVKFNVAGFGRKKRSVWEL